MEIKSRACYKPNKRWVKNIYYALLWLFWWGFPTAMAIGIYFTEVGKHGVLKTAGLCFLLWLVLFAACWSVAGMLSFLEK